MLIQAALIAAGISLLHPGVPVGGEVITGVATYYNPGVMERVIENRLAWGQLDLEQPHVGYVALKDCGRINEVVWIWWIDEERLEGPFLVADCANRDDWEHLERFGFAVDVDWQTAERHNMRAPVSVVVWTE